MKDKSTESIGLCLGGGGFRASFFHLGVLRYLAETGQLHNVRAISAVSGGAIMGAFLATKWNKLSSKGFSLEAFMNEIYEPFTQLVTTRNLRNRWLLLCLATLPWLFHRRFTWIKHWSLFFDSWFYGKDKLEMHELPKGLELVVNTTGLGTGKAYRFSRDFYGDDEEGYGTTYAGRPVRLADAVTASAAHLPMHISIGPNDERWFIDAGAYDNTGLDWFLDWEEGHKRRPETATKPDFLIVCEASPELPPWRWGALRLIPLYRMFPVLNRFNAIQYEQTRRVRKDWFIDRINPEKEICKKGDGIIISIDQVAGELKEAKNRQDYKTLVAKSLPKDLVQGRPGEGLPGVKDIRTDLNNFLPEEAALLAYHGYWLSHVYLTAFHESTKVRGHPLIGKPTWELPLSQEDVNAYLDVLRICDKRIEWRLFRRQRLLL